eukprot:CAMPEP_0206422910 /NCGR_PEP_ID=MMETSP0324_2-20121206/2374_1 /ASSEMBLY_ACC=CAM_ASM_000836 /TAXON_ID=2866 /ORGANISM="Crypthecodinium cohnii, Strain Seligo" /LENGTH=104 /DNA_ID=CAMNT_0053887385 /DNA_START=501 /DNA_END=816 /DNA_ORIENTATION=-
MDRAQGPEKFPGSSSRSNLCGAPPKDGPKWSIIPTRGIGGGDPGLEAGEFEGRLEAQWRLKGLGWSSANFAVEGAEIAARGSQGASPHTPALRICNASNLGLWG